MFVGITALALIAKVHITDPTTSSCHLQRVADCAHTPQRTVIAQVAGAVFGGPHSIGFFYIQATTALILVLAANTAFNGFPLLGSILARDRNLPGQLHNRGDRLAYSNGILALAVVAGVADLDLQGRRHPADPALHHRRVHVVHARPDRHGAALEPRRCAPSSDAAERRRMHALAGDQRLRRHPVRRRAGHRDHHQVHQGRLPGADRDADPLRAHARRSTSTTPAWPTSWPADDTGAHAARAQPRRSCWSRRCTSRRCGRWRSRGRRARTRSPR